MEAKSTIHGSRVFTKRPIRFAACLLMLVCFVGTVRAQVLVSWDVAGTGNPAVATLGATTITNNLSAAAGLNELSRTGLTASSANDAFSSTGWNTTDTFDEANDYISFTLAAAPGYEVTATSLAYDMSATSTAPNGGRWGYSIAGGAFVLQDLFTVPNGNFDSTWDFADFTTAGTIEFRFWGYGATSTGGGTASAAGAIRIRNLSGDDLVLNGSVALVPEPSTYALLSLAAVGLGAHVIRRRRR